MSSIILHKEDLQVSKFVIFGFSMVLSLAGMVALIWFPTLFPKMTFAQGKAASFLGAMMFALLMLLAVLLMPLAPIFMILGFIWPARPVFASLGQGTGGQEAVLIGSEGVLGRLRREGTRLQEEPLGPINLRRRELNLDTIYSTMMAEVNVGVVPVFVAPAIRGRYRITSRCAKKEDNEL